MRRSPVPALPSTIIGPSRPRRPSVPSTGPAGSVVRTPCRPQPRSCLGQLEARVLAGPDRDGRTPCARARYSILAARASHAQRRPRRPRSIALLGELWRSCRKPFALGADQLAAGTRASRITSRWVVLRVLAERLEVRPRVKGRACRPRYQRRMADGLPLTPSAPVMTSLGMQNPWSGNVLRAFLGISARSRTRAGLDALEIGTGSRSDIAIPRLTHRRRSPAAIAPVASRLRAR